MRWSIALVALASVAGCVQSDSVACADGTVCPRDRSCRLIVDSYQCVSDEQVAACDGKPDLAMCAGGTCLGGACLPPSCGDGTIDPVEVCDDSNATGGDGCAADCRSDESCGNGVVDLTVGEECDDGPAARGLSRDGCSSTCRRERPTWKNLPDYDELFGPGGRVGVAYDTTRGRVVVIGRSASSLVTVEYDAGVWSVATPTVAPSDRPGFDLAYDSERRRLVMFGGFGLRDTWEWDGARWELRAPATSPPARSGAAMAYDPLGHRVVMFGGRTNLISTNSEIADTWAWDGTSWTEITGPGPPERADATLAFDPVRGVLVLYGGQGILGASLGDTWELTGATWTLRAPATTPGPRREHAMSFDPKSRRILLHGGRDQTAVDTTYAWDGTDWTLVGSGPTDTLTMHMVTMIDEQRVLLFGSSGVYEWTGTGWTRTYLPLPGGLRRVRTAAAVDLVGRRLLVFGGYEQSALSDETDVWRGTWSRVFGPGPSVRAQAAMVYDERREEFVLFGGFSGSGGLGDTWIFDAQGWHQAAPATSPPPRYAHTLVYDRVRARTLLFGGTADTSMADTWTWDGVTWTRVADGPPARYDHAAAYDPVNGQVVVFGGTGSIGQPPSGDTWVWDGAWTMKSDTGPTGRSGTAMAWDAARERIVLYGGSSAAGAFSDVWEWDGAAWTQIAAVAIDPRSQHALVSALDGGGVLRFGLSGNQPVRDQVARLRWDSETAAEVCASGADLDGDGFLQPTCGGGDPDCWFLCTPLCPPGTSCAADATGCGDGTCDRARESCRTCPADCSACPVTCGDGACEAGEAHATCAGDCP